MGNEATQTHFESGPYAALVVQAGDSKKWIATLLMMVVVAPLVEAGPLDSQLVEPATVVAPIHEPTLAQPWDAKVLEFDFLAPNKANLVQNLVSVAPPSTPRVIPDPRIIESLTNPVREILSMQPGDVLEAIPFQPPRNLEMEVLSQFSISLTWEEPGSDGATAYRVYRADLPNKNGLPLLAANPRDTAYRPEPIAEVPVGTTSYQDDSVTLADEHYAYFVTAVYDNPLLLLAGSALAPESNVPGSSSMGLSPSMNDEVESLPSNVQSTVNGTGPCPPVNISFDPLLVFVQEDCIPPPPSLMVSVPNGTHVQVSM